MNFLYVWLALRARFVCGGRIHLPSEVEFRPPLIRWWFLSCFTHFCSVYIGDSPLYAWLALLSLVWSVSSFVPFVLEGLLFLLGQI